MNPYEVLGIKEGASKEEIKTAYRTAVKKYHPDKHQDNPLNELAEEKMQEVNEAYDMLMNGKYGGINGRAGGSYGTGAGAGSSSGPYERNNPAFYEIRKTIDRGDVVQAEQMLNSADNRGAEWHFLFGMTYARKGWYDQAIEFIEDACVMDPDNMEYRQALNRITGARNPYTNQSNNMGYNNSNDMCCKCCTAYCIADLCCDCM